MKVAHFARCRQAIAAVLLALAVPLAAAASGAAELAVLYAARVDRRIELPAAEVQRYGRLAEDALAAAGVAPSAGSYLLVLDRNPWTQVGLLLWRAAPGVYELVGASPVSTGFTPGPGETGDFRTPLGVFEHGPSNPGFRSRGSADGEHLPYGPPGARVFDLGTVSVARGWGSADRPGPLQLQLLAMGPAQMEGHLLGSARTFGKVAIPYSLDAFLDEFGVLDAAFENAARAGETPPVLHGERRPVAGAGRHVVIVDSLRDARPDWAQPATPVLAHPPALPPPQPPPPPPPPTPPGQQRFPIRR